MGGHNYSKADEIVKMLKYWNQLSLTKHQFGKAMFHDFQHQMMIPKKFCECFKGKLGEWCTLRGPSGDTWLVRVIRSREDCAIKIFSDGWADFVNDNGIKEADFLVFTSTGAPNQYNVSIMDRTGCEREAAFFTKNSKVADQLGHDQSELEPEPEPESEFDSDDSGSVDWLTDNQQHSHDSSSSSHGRGRAGGHKIYRRRRAFGKRLRLEDSDQDVEEYQPSRPKRRRLEEESSEDEEEYEPSRPKRGRPASSPGRGKQQSKTIYVSNRRPVSKDEKERAANLALKFELKNKMLFKDRPIFRVTMLPTHVTHGFHMTIPKPWANEHMIRGNHDVELRVPGNQGKWTVSCRWTTVTGQCQFRPRWPMFVRDNNLEEGDVCVFELVREGDLANRINPKFMVHIFRVVNKLTGLTEARMVI